MVHFPHYYMMNRCLWVALDYAPMCRRCNTQLGRCFAITYLISVVPDDVHKEGDQPACRAGHFVATVVHSFIET